MGDISEAFSLRDKYRISKLVTKLSVRHHLLFVICLFILFVFCVGVGIGCADEGTLFRNKEYAFRIVIPDGFHMKQGYGPNIKVKAVTDNGESVVVLAKTLSKEFRSLHFDRLTDTEIRQYIKDAFAQYKKAFPGMQLVQSRIAHLSNHRAAMCQAPRLFPTPRATVIPHFSRRGRLATVVF